MPTLAPFNLWDSNTELTNSTVVMPSARPHIGARLFSIEARRSWVAAMWLCNVPRTSTGSGLPMPADVMGIHLRLAFAGSHGESFMKWMRGSRSFLISTIPWLPII